MMVRGLAQTFAVIGDEGGVWLVPGVVKGKEAVGL